MSTINRFKLSNTQQAVLSHWFQQSINALKTLRNYPSAIFGTVVITFFVLLSILAPVIAPHDPQAAVFLTESGTPKALEPPAWDYFLGTTHRGEDVFSQWIWGGRISLGVGFASSIAATTMAVLVGITTAYYKGWYDLIVMRIVDMMYGIPPEPMILVLALLLGGGAWLVVLAYFLFLWRTFARLVRAEALSISNRPYVKAARAAGASDKRIMGVHILPNVAPIIFIEATIMIANGILLEAGMSFLGYGAQGATSWGTMLQFTFQSGGIREAWWWVLPPGLSITLVVLSFFFIMRALEEIIDPELSASGGQ